MLIHSRNMYRGTTTCNGFAKQGLGHTRIGRNPPGWCKHWVGDSVVNRLWRRRVPSTFMEVGTVRSHLRVSECPRRWGQEGHLGKEWQERERMLLRKEGATAQAQEEPVAFQKVCFLRKAGLQKDRGVVLKAINFSEMLQQIYIFWLTIIHSSCLHFPWCLKT